MSHLVYACLMAVDREHVLRSAADLLTRKSTATMDEVAKAAGISRATLHRQFAGRDALVRRSKSWASGSARRRWTRPGWKRAPRTRPYAGW